MMALGQQGSLCEMEQQRWQPRKDGDGVRTATVRGQLSTMAIINRDQQLRSMTPVDFGDQSWRKDNERVCLIAKTSVKTLLIDY
jgi:hypothetical protein